MRSPSGAASSSAKSISETVDSTPAGSPSTTIPRTLLTPVADATTFARNSGVVTTYAAPLSASTWRSSSSLRRNSTGVVAAPARHTAL